jgi:two-component system chemotaxis response regulator CheB
MARDIIVIGASWGGVTAIRDLLATLPADLPAAVFVVQHVAPTHTSLLPEIINFASPLAAAHPADGDEIVRGRVYVAPPDQHLLVAEGRVRVVRGPKENRARPAIDALFRSAAFVYGPRVTGVVLTGLLDDGTAGLYAVKRRGGAAVVQDPDDAAARDMPASALRHVEVDACLPLGEIGPKLVELATAAEPDPEAPQAPETMRIETEIMSDDRAHENEVETLGPPSAYACPECHGALFEVREGRVKRYRCRTGHGYSRASLLADLAEKAESALWLALRALEEVEANAREMVADGELGGPTGEGDRMAAADLDALRSIALRYQKPRLG